MVQRKLSIKWTPKNKTKFKNFNWIPIIFLILVTLPLISSVPAFQTNVNGLTITGVDFSAIQTQTQRTAVAYVYNTSNGLPILTSLACQFQVFRVGDTGALIFTNQTPNRINNSYYFGIPNNIYNESAEYTRVIQCNSTAEGGFYKSTFIANANGSEFTLPKAIFYVAILSLLVFLFMINAVAFTGLRGGNQRGEDGNIISVNWFKYLKSTLFVIGWGLLAAILYIASALANNYVESGIYTILFMLFRIVTILIIPVLFLYFFWLFINVFDDRKIQKLIDQGIGTTYR